jgi:FtsH-binding integral membrane protein
LDREIGVVPSATTPLERFASALRTFYYALAFGLACAVVIAILFGRESTVVLVTSAVTILILLSGLWYVRRLRARVEKR